MKLMAYNLLNGANKSLDLVIKTVSLQNPDVLVINEANGFDKNQNQILKDFALKTGLPFFDLAKCGDGNNYHVAIFSKLPLKNLEHLDGFARAAIAVELDTSFGEVCIIATHLNPHRESVRLPEVEKIISYQSKFPNKIIMGDLNSLTKQDDYDPSMVFAFNTMQTIKYTANERLLFDVMKRFSNAGYVDPAIITNQQKIFTAPTNINEFKAHSNMRVDYILLSENLAPKLKSYRVIKNEITENASDHYPVEVEL